MASTAKETESQRQVRQMVNFIMQEANEKVNEIKIKTDHDFNLEKQTLIHNGKMKVQEEYTKKQKDLEILERVSRSSAVATSRVKKMKARDDLLEQLKRDALTKLSSVVNTPQYPTFLRQLIVQGLIKIEEPIVELQVRAEDRNTVAKILPDALAEYRTIMSGAGHMVNPQVTISDVVLPSKTTSGGLVLTALQGRIRLNQTIEERLNIVYTDMMPSVRYGLFPEM